MEKGKQGPSIVAFLITRIRTGEGARANESKGMKTRSPGGNPASAFPAVLTNQAGFVDSLGWPPANLPGDAHWDCADDLQRLIVTQGRPLQVFKFLLDAIRRGIVEQV